MDVGAVVAVGWGAIIRGGPFLIFSRSQKILSLDGFSSSQYPERPEF